MISTGESYSEASLHDINIKLDHAIFPTMTDLIRYQRGTKVKDQVMSFPFIPALYVMDSVRMIIQYLKDKIETNK
jgi:hypothetical protein